MATVRVFVSDVSRARRFYEAVLGFSLIEEWGPAMAIMGREDLELWLAGPGTSAAKPWTDGTQPGPGGFTRIVLSVSVDANLVEANGGRIANGPLKGPGGTQTILLDPDGNSIELFES